MEGIQQRQDDTHQFSECALSKFKSLYATLIIMPTSLLRVRNTSVLWIQPAYLRVITINDMHMDFPSYFDTYCNLQMVRPPKSFDCKLLVNDFRLCGNCLLATNCRLSESTSIERLEAHLQIVLALFYFDKFLSPTKKKNRGCTTLIEACNQFKIQSQPFTDYKFGSETALANLSNFDTDVFWLIFFISNSPQLS